MFDRLYRRDIALRTHQNRYVTALNHQGGWRINGLAQRLLGWEIFSLIYLSESHVALKTAHGRYVSASDEQSRWHLYGGAERILGWEVFELVEVEPGKIGLLSSHQRWVRVGAEALGFPLLADSPSPRAECLFSRIFL
ncbi:hypothetical protein IV102_06990 [bacterium]|nr:hypothetical protein [bacterium]